MDKEKNALTVYEMNYLKAILREKQASLMCDLVTTSERDQCYLYNGIRRIESILSKLTIEDQD